MMKKIIFAAILMALSHPSSAEEIIFKFDNAVALNMVRVEIPAPIEITRAQDDQVRGELKIDLENPTKSHGSVEVDLEAIKAMTFTDQDKNETQTEHMKNWFEIGPDVKQDLREKNRWVRFVIKKITRVEPVYQKATLFKDEIGTGRSFQLTAEGEMTVHGITKSKTIDLNLVIYDIKEGGTRYVSAKKVLMLRTQSPLLVSLKEHDVKPRDTTGKFLAKALSTVGLKISDEAQVFLDLRAYQPK